MRRRSLAGALAAGALALALPSAAAAAVAFTFSGPFDLRAARIAPNVVLTGDGFGFLGLPAEPMDVTVTQRDRDVLVEDRRVLLLRSLTAEGGCAYLAPLTSASCAANRHSCSIVEGGLLPDVLVVRGGGCMRVQGAEGDDRIDAVDGGPSTVRCGPGADTVRADAGDVVDASCERVTRVGA